MGNKSSSTPQSGEQRYTGPFLHANLRIKHLNDNIDDYVNTYCRVYEFVRSSSLNRLVSNIPVGGRAQYEESKQALQRLYDRLSHRRVNFDDIYETAFQLVLQIRDERIPSDDHNITMQDAMREFEIIKQRITEEIRLLNRIPEETEAEERRFGLITTQRSDNKPPLPLEWFPIGPSGETIAENWYWYAHWFLRAQLEFDADVIETALTEKRQKIVKLIAHVETHRQWLIENNKMSAAEFEGNQETLNTMLTKITALQMALERVKTDLQSELTTASHWRDGIIFCRMAHDDIKEINEFVRRRMNTLEIDIPTFFLDE